MKQTIILVILIAVLGTSPFKSSSQNFKQRTYQAYISGDLEQWKSVITMMKSDNGDPDSADAFELALTYYGLTAQSLFRGDERNFDQSVSATHDILDQLLDSHETWAEPYAVSSFIMGFQIADSPMKGVYLGAKSMSRMNKALELNDQSPVVIQLYAGSKYFSPKFFGGDIHEAIKNYQIAIQLFEEKGRTDEWLYLDALAFLGKAYMRTGRANKAREVYQKALLVEPEFLWVENKLMPRAEQALKTTN